jgi:hypothetical protein
MNIATYRSVGKMFLMATSFAIVQIALVPLVASRAQAVDVIYGKFINADGTPAAHMEVQAAWKDPDNGGRAMTAADGSFSIGLRPNCINGSLLGSNTTCGSLYGEWRVWFAPILYNSMPLNAPVVQFTADGQAANVNCSPAGCVLGTLPTPITPTAPTVKITAPAASTIVSGIVNIAGTATNIASIQVSIDAETFLSVSGTSEWSASVDTHRLTNGRHKIIARVVGSMTGTADFASVSITVNNPVAPASSPALTKRLF